MWRWTLAGLLMIQAQASAAEALYPELAKGLAGVAAKLKERKAATVHVEEPTGPEPSLANADKDRVKTLIEGELKRLGIEAVAGKCRHSLRLDYAKAKKDEKGHLPPFRFDFLLKDEEGKPETFVGEVRDEFRLAWLAGLLPSPILPALHELAGDIVRVLEREKETSVALDALRGPGGDGHGVTRELRLVLESLKGKRLRIAPGAALRLRGSYGLLLREDRVEVEVAVEMVDRLGATIWTCKKGLPMKGVASADPGGVSTVMALFSGTAEIPPAKTEFDRVKTMVDRIKKPTAHISKDGWVSAREGSPFAVAIRVKDKIRIPVLKDGQAFVELEEGEEYETGIRTALGHDTAAGVMIDTLSMFAFSEHPGYSHLILPKGSEPTWVKGWHRTNEKSDAFRIAPLADTPAGKLIRTGPGIGTVSVLFKAAWAEGAKPPEDEKDFKDRSRGGPVATAKGTVVPVKFTEVKRHIGALRACVTIRYERKK